MLKEGITMRAKTYPLHQFTYSKESKRLTTEASQLAAPGELFGLLSNDRSGIKIHSESTGAVHEFSIVNAEFDADNDVIAWHLKSATTDVSVAIYND